MMTLNKSMGAALVLGMQALSCASADGEGIGEPRLLAPITVSAPEEGAVPGSSEAPSAVQPAENAEELAFQRAQLIEDTVGAEFAHRVLNKPGYQAPPVYVLSLENGNRVEWREPIEGIALVAEFSSGSEFVLDGFSVAGKSAKEVFQKIAPNAATPPELEGLDARVLEMRPVYLALQAVEHDVPAALRAPRPILEDVRGGAEADNTQPFTPQENTSEDFGQLGSALTSTQCVDDCVALGFAFDYVITRKDKTRNDTIAKDDVSEVKGKGCCVSGHITYRADARVWWDWDILFSRDLDAGQRVGLWTATNDIDFDLETYLLNFSSGDKGAQCQMGIYF
jgi:hypothetical protein